MILAGRPHVSVIWTKWRHLSEWDRAVGTWKNLPSSLCWCFTSRICWSGNNSHDTFKPLRFVCTWSTEKKNEESWPEDRVISLPHKFCEHNIIWCYITLRYSWNAAFLQESTGVHFPQRNPRADLLSLALGAHVWAGFNQDFPKIKKQHS